MKEMLTSSEINENSAISLEDQIDKKKKEISEAELKGKEKKALRLKEELRELSDVGVDDIDEIEQSLEGSEDPQEKQEKIKDLEDDINEEFNEDSEEVLVGSREQAREVLDDILNKDLINNEDLLLQIEHHSSKANQDREDWPSAYHYVNGGYMKADGSEGYYPDKFIARVGASLALITKGIIENSHKKKLKKLESEERKRLDATLDRIDKICRDNNINTLKVLSENEDNFRRQVEKIESQIDNLEFEGRGAQKEIPETRFELANKLHDSQRKHRHSSKLMMCRYAELHKRFNSVEK